MMTSELIKMSFASQNAWVEGLSSDPDIVAAFQKLLDVPFGRDEALTKSIVYLVAKKCGVYLNDVQFLDVDEFGAYGPKHKVLILSQKILSDKGNLISTILHELRHAYQHQHLQYGTDDYAKAVAQNLKNYEPSGDTARQTANYLTNIIEVDAIFSSLACATKILEQCEQTPEVRRLLTSFGEESKQYTDTLIEIVQIQSMERKIYAERRRMLCEAYAKLFDSTIPDEEKSQILKNDLAEINAKFAKIKNRGMLEVSQEEDLYFIAKYIFDNVPIEDLVRNIDHPEVRNLSCLEKKYLRHYGGTYAKNVTNPGDWVGYFDRIKEYAATAKALMDYLKIPYDKNDSGRMYTQFLERAPAIGAKLFAKAAHAKPEEKRKIEEFHNFLYRIGFFDQKFNYYAIFDNVIEEYGMMRIRWWYRGDDENKKIWDYSLKGMEESAKKLAQKKKDAKVSKKQK